MGQGSLVGPFRGRDGQNAATSPWPSCGHGVPLWGALLRWDWVPPEGLGRTLGLWGSPRSCCQAGPRRGSARRRSSTSPGFCCCGRLPFSKGKKKRRGHQEAFGEAGPPVEMQVWPPASLGRRRGRGAAAPVPQLDVCGREKKKEERGEKKGVDPTTSVRGREGWK